MPPVRLEAQDTRMQVVVRSSSSEIHVIPGTTGLSYLYSRPEARQTLPKPLLFTDAYHPVSPSTWGRLVRQKEGTLKIKGISPPMEQHSVAETADTAERDPPCASTDESDVEAVPMWRSGRHVVAVPISAHGGHDAESACRAPSSEARA